MGSEEEIDRISEKLVNEIEMFPFLTLMTYMLYLKIKILKRWRKFFYLYSL